MDSLGIKSRCVVLFLILLVLAIAVPARTVSVRIVGTVLDPVGNPVAAAHIHLKSDSGAEIAATTGSDGGFGLQIPAPGAYTVRVEAAGFATMTRTLDLNATTTSLVFRLEHLTAASEQVIVTGDASEVTLTSPDPSEKVIVREELLDANPGRPGAPVSIPGLPIETASGGIKAPQYFVPGVAGDHGEPIAQYIAVGGYLVTNNLSANAHGNGYADPNIYVSGVLGV